MTRVSLLFSLLISTAGVARAADFTYTSGNFSVAVTANRQGGQTTAMHFGDGRSMVNTTTSASRMVRPSASTRTQTSSTQLVGANGRVERTWGTTTTSSTHIGNGGISGQRVTVGRDAFGRPVNTRSAVFTRIGR